jgi:signal peptidase I
MEEDNKQEENNSAKPAQTRKGIKKYMLLVWEIVKIAVIAFIIVAPIRYFLFQPFIVSGASMSPNFATGDYLIVDEISYRLSNPQRGDVIVFNASFIPGYANQRFIKRVVGLPGETVDITNGQVEIIKDGKTTILDEKYLPDDLKTYVYNNSGISLAPEEITLKPDQYFVLGDNRTGSYDSRYWGVVPRSDIIGKASIRILPLTSLSEISRPVY